MSYARKPFFHRTAPPITSPSGLRDHLNDQLSEIEQAMPPWQVRSVTADFTANTRVSFLLVSANAAPVTISLPKAANSDGYTVTIKKTDASGHAVTIAATVDGTVNPTLAAQYNSITIIAAQGQYWKIASV